MHGAGASGMPSNQPIALPPRRRLHLFALLAALVLAGLGLAACGSDSGGNEDAQQVINETFNGKKKVESGKINMSVTAKLEATGAAAAGLKDPVSLKLSGPFQSRGQDKLPAVDLDLSVAGGGQTFTAGAITTGDEAFISYQGTDYKVPPSQFRRYKRQVERDARNNSDNNNQFDLAQLGINPRNWIENPKNEGTEDVGGAEVIHISADVNVSAFVDDLDNLLKKASDLGVDQQQQVPTKLTARQKKQIEDSIQDVRFDLFTGKDDKVLRRIEVEFGFELPKSLSTQAQGVKSGTVKLALEIADLNEDQRDHGAQERAATVRASEPARPARQPWGRRGQRLVGQRLVFGRLVGQRLVRRLLVGRGFGSRGHGPRHRRRVGFGCQQQALAEVPRLSQQGEAACRHREVRQDPRGVANSA